MIALLLVDTRMNRVTIFSNMSKIPLFQNWFSLWAPWEFQKAKFDQNQWTFSFAPRAFKFMKWVTIIRDGWFQFFHLLVDFLVFYVKLCLLRFKYIFCKFQKAQDHYFSSKIVDLVSFFQHRYCYVMKYISANF